MTKRRFITIFALTGGVLPLAFMAALYFIRAQESISLAANIERVMLILWPSSLLQMAADGARPGDVKAYAIALSSIVINALLYALIGLCTWLAFKRNIMFLLIPVSLLGFLCWQFI